MWFFWGSVLAIQPQTHAAGWLFLPRADTSVVNPNPGDVLQPGSTPRLLWLLDLSLSRPPPEEQLWFGPPSRELQWLGSSPEKSQRQGPAPEELQRPSPNIPNGYNGLDLHLESGKALSYRKGKRKYQFLILPKITIPPIPEHSRKVCPTRIPI